MKSRKHIKVDPNGFVKVKSENNTQRTIHPTGIVSYTCCNGLHRTTGAALLLNDRKEYYIDNKRIDPVEFFMLCGCM